MTRATLYNKQTLLKNVMVVGQRYLTMDQWVSIDCGKIEYHVSGETDMATYRGTTFTIQSFVYSDCTERTIVLCDGKSHDTNSYRELSLSDAAAEFEEINRRIENDELEQNQDIALAVGEIIEGLKRALHKCLGYTI